MEQKADVARLRDGEWCTKLDLLQLGDNTTSFVTQDACINTGASLIYLPPTYYFNTFVPMIEGIDPDLNCSSDYCYTTNLSCETIWPSMQNFVFVMSGNWYTMVPQGITISNLNGSLCAIGVSYTDSDDTPIQLGDPFLRSFAPLFNYKKNTIAFTVN
jgi:hypothetical protein